MLTAPPPLLLAPPSPAASAFNPARPQNRCRLLPPRLTRRGPKIGPTASAADYGGSAHGLVARHVGRAERELCNGALAMQPHLAKDVAVGHHILHKLALETAGSNDTFEVLARVVVHAPRRESLVFLNGHVLLPEEDTVAPGACESQASTCVVPERGSPPTNTYARLTGSSSGPESAQRGVPSAAKPLRGATSPGAAAGAAGGRPAARVQPHISHAHNTRVERHATIERGWRGTGSSSMESTLPLTHAIRDSCSTIDDATDDGKLAGA
eukprot:CAMPEP_0179880062 /NCGR_PEP_ID=MMETSP0982-20121206/26567_1 /TAXON_ID=483367 /ORGANISM="non described non described, Strain CCMP 2436" /LENGTH=267 /DNA_ID=CAMNT_0021773591 /DNA_START=125 /DNA_END=926 /DNA_ORIENTATION=-